jgi:shikimate kinase
MSKKKTIKKVMKKQSSKKSTEFAVFMHITSFPGAGKTTIGKWFQSKGFIVQDLDDFLPTKVMSHSSSKKYVEMKINTFLKKQKPSSKIILVGTGCLEPESAAVPIIDAEYKIWLNVSLEESCTRAVKRQIEWLCTHQKEFLSQAKKSSAEDFAIYLENYYSPKKRATDWKDLLPIYKALKYHLMMEDEIKKLA